MLQADAGFTSRTEFSDEQPALDEGRFVHS